MKCSRQTCPNAVRAKGLCHLHYAVATRGTAGYTSSTPAQQHITALMADGLSLSEIIRISGVSWPTIKNVQDGGKIYKTTERRLLAVTTDLSTRVARESKTPVVGVARRLRALAVLGYSNHDLARMLNLATVTIWRYQNTSDQIEVYAARKVMDLYDKLCMTPGRSKITAGRAKKRRWPSPLAWDEETIDDPTAHPDMGEKSRPEFPEKYAELVDLGITSDEHIAERLGIDPRSVKRQRERYGLKGAAA